MTRENIFMLSLTRTHCVDQDIVQLLFPSATAPIEYQNYYERDGTEVRNESTGLVGGVMKKSEQLICIRNHAAENNC